MFSRTEYGKPFLKIDPHEMCFNVSHSGSLLALAVSLNMDVGIDLEHDPGEDDLSGISACISADFYERLLQVPAKMQKHLFYNYWTANEAILKCIGNGLDRFIPPGDLDSPSGRFNVDGSKGYYQHENIPGIFSLCIAWQRPEYLP
jgi:4'-phosphopantetheinyl transferase